MRKNSIAPEKVVAKFSPRRAKALTEALWREARGQDTPAVWRAARVAEAYLKEAGIADARIEDIPSDGKISVGGWMMPPTWSAQMAQLEMLTKPRRRLADLENDALSLALYSSSTPGAKWIEGNVWIMPAPPPDSRTLPPDERLQQHAAAAAGKFVLMNDGKPNIAMNRLAAHLGCLAIVAPHPGPVKNAARYLNYSAPVDIQSARVPVFSLNYDAGCDLRAALAADPQLRLRARARARLEEGVMPLVTASIGSGGPPLYICGHIDEIGAQDNASGCAVAIEVLCALAKLPPRTLRRQIRLYLTSEVRGQQWWFNNRERPSLFLGGINLDMVGGDLRVPERKMNVLTGFRQRPHFAGRLVLEAARFADKLVGEVGFATRSNYPSDAVPGLTRYGGHVSLEQKTCATYHSSADTMAIISSRMLKWSGVAASHFLYRMATLENRELIAWGRKWQPDATESDPKLAAARLAVELGTLRLALRGPQISPKASIAKSQTAEDYYNAGVNRRTGLWPETVERLRLEAIIRERIAKLKSEAGEAPAVAPVKPLLVPLATGNGFFSFENHVTEEEIKLLKSTLGLSPNWSAHAWITALYNNSDGKHTIEEIAASLQRVGLKIDLAQARKVALYLVQRGVLRLRPIIAARDIKRALRQIGVRRSSILLTHTSLSRFGYIEGGAATVVSALREVLGPRGTLVIPTHSLNGLGSPPYDPKNSPATIGAIPEFFRKLPEVVRSPHATHSVAALGPKAFELTSCHLPELTPMAREGFWGKLCELEGDVLLLCPIRSATLFHAGEAWLDLPMRHMVAHALDDKGKRRVYEMPNAPWHVDHFEKHLAAPLRSKGIMKVATLGDGELYLAPARAMAEISVRDLAAHPEHALGKEGACTCKFCETLKAGLAQGWRAPKIQLWD